MKEVPVTNNHDYTIHVGGKSIPPDETRMVDESMLPDAPERMNSEALPEQETVDPLLQILDHSIPDLGDIVPGLSLEELDALEQAENNGKTRKGVLTLIAEARLALASGSDADGSTDETDTNTDTDGDAGDGSDADSSDDAAK